MIQEQLRINLPKAMDLGNLQIGSRGFKLTSFVFAANAYRKVTLTELVYTPGFVPFQVWVYKGNIEVGQYSGIDGRLILDYTFGMDEPLTVVLYNLSPDTVLSVLVKYQGFSINDVPR